MGWRAESELTDGQGTIKDVCRESQNNKIGNEFLHCFKDGVKTEDSWKLIKTLFFLALSNSPGFDSLSILTNLQSRLHGTRRKEPHAWFCLTMNHMTRYSCRLTAERLASGMERYNLALELSWWLRVGRATHTESRDCHGWWSRHFSRDLFLSFLFLLLSLVHHNGETSGTYYAFGTATLYLRQKLKGKNFPIFEKFT